jgi:hypothetical protein
MSPQFRASARRRDLWVVAAVTALAAAGLVVGHLLRPWLSTITIASYGVADVGGLMFLLRYVRTDWRNHPWGRHVMAFMVCLEILFTLALSRRVFGDWPGLPETGFVASWAFAGIVWWRYRLQVRGEHRARRD